MKGVTGDGGSGNAGKIADETLKTGPSAGSFRAGQCLRYGPGIGSGDAEENDAENDGGNRKFGATDYGKANKNARNRESAAGEGLARELLLRPIGRTVYWMPPYCVSDDEMELLATRTLEIVDCA